MGVRAGAGSRLVCEPKGPEIEGGAGGLTWRVWLSGAAEVSKFNVEVLGRVPGLQGTDLEMGV